MNAIIFYWFQKENSFKIIQALECKIRLYQIFKLIKLKQKFKPSFENNCGKNCFSINYQNNPKESQLK